MATVKREGAKTYGARSPHIPLGGARLSPRIGGQRHPERRWAYNVRGAQRSTLL